MATIAPARAPLKRLKPLDAAVHLEELLSRPYEYRSWEEVYRDQWTWTASSR